MTSQQPIEQPLPLPTLNDKRSIIPAAHPDPNIDLDNIQGDIYPTFPKKSERFIFFHIKHVDEFRAALGEFKRHITTAAKTMDNLRQVQAVRLKYTHGPRPLVRLEQYQIGFSHAAFECLNITGDLGDPDFNAGPQLLQAVRKLGDRPTGTGPKDVDWDPIWKAYTVHGVIVAASESEETCDHSVRHVRRIFGHSIHIVNVVSGCVRNAPGESGHEHFGFLDGISQPAVRGMADFHPGQPQCDPGVILMNHKTDPYKDRPDWAKDGSFMAFRKLQQLVPEFDRFLVENPLKHEGLNEKEAIDLRGAKMVGRWKSGAPIELAPERDDPKLAEDPDRNNDFHYLPADSVDKNKQSMCPFSAHIRKTSPRATIPKPFSEQALIVRAGIPYGPEVSDEERAIDTTIADRGLLFVSYQSGLQPGFVFLQNFWASNDDFPLPKIGHDPVIGNKLTPPGQELTSDRARFATTGEKPSDDKPAPALKMPCDFVVARGGEYFFVPSMSTIDKLVEGEELPAGSTPPVLVAQIPGLNFNPSGSA